MAETKSAGGVLLSDALEAQIDAELSDARSTVPSLAARRVEYLAEARLLIFHLTDGSRFPLPVEEVEELARATDAQLSHFDLEAGGRMIHFPDFDGNTDVASLVEGVRGRYQWMV